MAKHSQLSQLQQVLYLKQLKDVEILTGSEVSTTLNVQASIFRAKHGCPSTILPRIVYVSNLWFNKCYLAKAMSVLEFLRRKRNVMGPLRGLSRYHQMLFHWCSVQSYPFLNMEKYEELQVGLVRKFWFSVWLEIFHEESLMWAIPCCIL